MDGTGGGGAHRARIGHGSTMGRLAMDRGGGAIADGHRPGCRRRGCGDPLAHAIASAALAMAAVAAFDLHWSADMAAHIALSGALMVASVVMGVSVMLARDQEACDVGGRSGGAGGEGSGSGHGKDMPLRTKVPKAAETAASTFESQCPTIDGRLIPWPMHDVPAPAPAAPAAATEAAKAEVDP